MSMDGDPLLLTGFSEYVLSFTFAPEDGGRYCFQNVFLFEHAKNGQYEKILCFYGPKKVLCTSVEFNIRFGNYLASK